MSAASAARTALLGALVGLVAGLGCDDDEPRTGSLRGDAKELRRVMESDPAVSVLREVDRALDRQDEEQAARVLERSGVPAARRQLERVEQLEVTTEQGGRLRDRAADAYTDRVEALESYRDVLEAEGPSEQATDDKRLDALRDQRRADQEVLDLLDRLDRLAAERGSGR